MLKVLLEAVIGERRKTKKGKRKEGLENEENMEMEGRRLGGEQKFSPSF
jgi:hypothetical protein